MKKTLFVLSVAVGLCGSSLTHAQLFRNVESAEIPYYVGSRTITPKDAKYVRADFEQLKSYLDNAPKENSTDFLPISIPMPDGSFAQFLIQRYDMMEADLANKFPGIKTFFGKGVTDEYANIRLDYTSQGFHASILSPINGTVYIDPFANQSQDYYVSYHKNDLENIHQFSCMVEDVKEDNVLVGGDKDFLPIGTELRTYRLAVAATGEYTTYHGGTVAGGQAAIVTMVNRVNQVYELDLSVRLVLIANNNILVYTSGSADPFSNNNAGALIDESQTVITNSIGTANFDVGHTVSTGGGGLASLGVVCSSNRKASGITGSPAPTNDPFWIDYVAHELGHQFNSNHTFNSNNDGCQGNRSAQNAYEPGSGSTIMAYAGLCGSNSNIQNSSDAYFHTRSYERIRFHITGSANTCANISNTGNVVPEIQDIIGGATAPISTPFKLTGVATDADNDKLTYCWEQYDLRNATTLTAAVTASLGTIPLFRSYSPDTSATRVFPRMATIVSGINNNREKLPTLTREMNFRLTVRDNKANGGATIVDSAKYYFTATAGPFIVTSPTLATEVWTAGTLQEVTWDVANTNIAPVNCQKVNIRLSLDGGFTYPILLASNVDNNGSYNAYVPASNDTETKARVMVESVGNIFFNISGKNFRINPGGNVSVNEVELASQVKVYPNPASDYVTLSLDQNIALNNASFEMVNLLGQTITKGIITDYNTIVSLNGFAAGMYLVKISANEQTNTQSIIIR